MTEDIETSYQKRVERYALILMMGLTFAFAIFIIAMCWAVD